MTTWLFAATATQADIVGTFELAADEGLIVRPYFDNREQWRSRNHNSRIRENDILILAFTDRGRVIDSAAFTLSPKMPEGPGTSLSDHAERNPLVPAREYPNVFSVYPRNYLLIQECGYGDASMDPKLEAWVCLTVVSNDISINEEALQVAYRNRTAPMSTINPISDEVLEFDAERETTPILIADNDLQIIGRDLEQVRIVPEQLQATVIELSQTKPEMRRVEKKSDAGRIAVGIDFSGGKAAASKIWLAEIVSDENQLLKLRRLENGFSFDALQEEISREQSADILLDFPFGLATITCENLNLANDVAYSQIWARVALETSAEAFRTTARAGQFGAGSERAHKRNIDRQMKTPFAPINLRMFRQTYFGQAKVLHQAAMANPHIRFLPWSEGEATEGQPRIGEGCPASMLKMLDWRSDGYKGNSENCKQRRTQLLQMATERFDLSIPVEFSSRIVSDIEGDAMDALLLAIAAAQISDAELEAGKLHCENHPTEGFVYLGLTAAQDR